MSDILEQTHQLLNDRVNPSLVLLWYNNDKDKNPSRASIGTGTLVKYKEHRFVFSCQHVVCDWMSANQAVFVLQADSKTKFPKDIVESWGCEAPPQDIGYLRLKDSVSISDLICLTGHDLQEEAPDWNKYGALVLGYPGELVKNLAEQKTQEFRGLSLMGMRIRTHDDAVRELFDYPKTEDIEIKGAVKMPEPFGISGSSVWVYEITPGKVGDYTKAKVFAIENAWISAKRMYLATPVKYLIELIDHKEKF
jgi:hypothetical protein